MKPDLLDPRKLTSRMVLTAILVFVVLATAGCGTLGLEWRRVIVQPFLEYKTDPCRVPTKWDSDKGEWVVDFGRIDSWNIGRCVEKWKVSQDGSGTPTL